MCELSKILKSLERPNFPFVPNQDFYEKTGIKRKRFAQLLKNQKSPTLTELENLSKFFNVPVTDFVSPKEAN